MRSFGVWHFSFTVSDIERSIVFYRDVLGFVLIHRQVQQNACTSRLVGYENAHLRVAQFAITGAPRGLSTHDLELVEYVSPRGSRGEAEIRNPGEGHLALCVDDADAEYAPSPLAGGGVCLAAQPCGGRRQPWRQSLLLP